MSYKSFLLYYNQVLLMDEELDRAMEHWEISPS